MPGPRFAFLVDSIANVMTRRAATGLLTGVPLGLAALSDDVASKKRKAKKRQYCLNGKNVNAKSKRKKQQMRKKGADPGRCKTCMPVCPPNTCGDDGCGGVCACGAGTICVANACQVCDVGCSGSPQACGEALRTAVAAGGDVYVCPGRYTTSTIPGFEILNDTRVFGAGSGDDPSANTILDALRRAKFRVISVPSTSANVTLSGLRITGGIGQDNTAGGVQSISRATLDVENCVITDNIGDDGAGLLHKGVLQMSGTVVSRNTVSAGAGGGISLQPQLANQTSVITSSVISDNFANFGAGIFLFTISDTQSLRVESSTQVVNNTTPNSGPEAGGAIKLDGLTTLQVGTVIATGATITGNTEVQCIGVGVTGC